MKTNLTIAYFTILPFILFSQNKMKKCENSIYFQEMILKDPSLVTKIHDIEDEINQSMIRQTLTARTYDSITIPVVVHILYHTSDENLSTEQIQSQIDALNRDFNAQNKDLIYTPSVYKDLIANCNIHFVLANRNVKGQETEGIIRKFTVNKSWANFDDIKTPSKGGSEAWDASQYLNIWVGNLDGNVLGISSFPGMKKELDGVVIDYAVFGSNNYLHSTFNLGRTCVHEVGHWLNLIHVSADTPCGDDFVADTPPQEIEHYFKPFFPQYSKCNGIKTIDMTMNFMTYVDDDRMYMFTKGQKKRIWALFDTGGVRERLKYSAGWVKPLNQLADKKLFKAIVFPNPVTDELTIKMENSDPICIQIIDSSGKICFQSEECSSLIRIDVYDLWSGVYYLKAIKDKNVFNTTFIKL